MLGKTGSKTRKKKLAGTKPLEGALEIDLERIVPDPEQPRKDFRFDDQVSLRDSLKTEGQLQPIRVRYDAGLDEYVIIDGERRWRAADLAGWTTIQCVVDEAGGDPLLAQLASDKQRENLSPIEKGKAYRRAMEENGWSGAELSRRLGMHPATVNRLVNFLKLPSEVQAKIHRGEIGELEAREFATRLPRRRGQPGPKPSGKKHPTTVEQTRKQHAKAKARGGKLAAEYLREHGAPDGLAPDLGRKISMAEAEERAIKVSMEIDQELQRERAQETEELRRNMAPDAGEMHEHLAPDLSHDPSPEAQVEFDEKLEALRSKHGVLKKSYKAALEKIGRLAGRIDVITSLPEPDAPQFAPPKAEPAGDAGAILVLGDWHAEQRVDKKVMNAYNEYNLDVFHRRARAAFESGVRMLRFAQHLSNIDELVVLVLGDMINGYIHEEFQATNEVGPVMALSLVRDNLLGGLRYLHEQTEMQRFRVVCCHGNHARMTQKPRHGDAAETSLETLLYHDLAMYYRREAPDVEWEIATGPEVYFDLKGHTIRAQHGDRIKYRGGVGGIQIPLNKRIPKWNKKVPASFNIFGHFHQFNRGQDWLSCGSLVGYDSYAQELGLDPEQPSQAIVVFDRHRKDDPVMAEKVFVEG